MLVTGPWPPVEEHSSWRSVDAWCLEAEVANGTGNGDLARRSDEGHRAVLGPPGHRGCGDAGRSGGRIPGTGGGHAGRPARDADRAEELASAWGFGAHLAWLAAHRRQRSI